MGFDLTWVPVWAWGLVCGLGLLVLASFGPWSGYSESFIGRVFPLLVFVGLVTLLSFQFFVQGLAEAKGLKIS